ncbi:MAG: hypothetical protein ACXU9B_21330 [Reyranella sp.]
MSDTLSSADIHLLSVWIATIAPLDLRRDKNVIAKEKAATMPRASGTPASSVMSRKNLVRSGFSRVARGTRVGRVARPTIIVDQRCDQNFTTVTLETAARASSNI